MKTIATLFLVVLCTTAAEARSVYVYREVETTQRNMPDQNETRRKVYVFKESKTARVKPQTTIEGFAIKNSSIKLETGYREGYMAWTIGERNHPIIPNVLSELDFNDIKIAQLFTRSKLNFWNGLQLGIDFDYGMIVDGEGRDSDYLFDNRVGEFSRSTFEIDDHSVLDTSIYVGFDIYSLIKESENFSLSPFIGYSYHEQELNFVDGIQRVNSFLVPIPVGTRIVGLDSEYRAEWYGPFTGFELEFGQYPWKFSTRFEQHWVDYQADATWNLRTDFSQPISFEHLSEGEGQRYSFSLSRQFDHDWDGVISVGLEVWESEAGLDRTFFSDGSVGTIGFNGTEWGSAWASIGIQKTF